MAKIWFNKVVMHRCSFEDVPARYQDAVKTIGKQYVADGKMSEEEYIELFGEE